MIWLPVILFSLLSCAVDDPVTPTFVFPQGVDPLGHQANDLRQAFNDAVILARMTVITFNPSCDPYLSRYFQPSETKFVSDVFRTIANIPPDLSIKDSNGDLIPNLADIINTRGNNPKFSQLSISIGDHPDKKLPSSFACDDDDDPDAYYTASKDNADDGTISMCTRVWDHPALKDILDPPSGWENEPGFGCSGLLNHDSDLMQPAGGVILHELLHWAFFFKNDVPNWDTVIPLTPAGDHRIRDYQGPAGGIPPNGYGPYNAPLLKNLPKGAYSLTTNNVDNYVYYALSKYWSTVCNKSFAQSTDPDDNSLRDDSWNDYQSLSPLPPPPSKRSIIHRHDGDYHYNSTSHTYNKALFRGPYKLQSGLDS
ncbi:hypothetical protein EDD36DRAFT_314226 [Exophiala viscosa]|uniref:Lysine-specific metallo-endopeptidase domain-containing protein n=1 Tax=Exophiala viscosa TaxID=2486360 RepID=A0AAN6DSB2_9EURO|nr:hypothetical protein EDD36DRAFT_314226 [Exophiala viscosa]